MQRSSEQPIVYHLRPSVRAMALFVLARIFLKPIYKLWPQTDRGIRSLALIEAILERAPAAVGVSRTTTDLGGVLAERIAPSEVAGDALPGATVLYLHGGAFMFCGIATHRRLCGRLAKTLGVPVYSLNYRQLPDVGAGTSLQDAYAGVTGRCSRYAQTRAGSSWPATTWPRKSAS